MKAEKIIGYTIGLLIVSGFFYWYNKIWYHQQLPYISLLALSCLSAWMCVAAKFLRIPFGILFFATCILQILSWSNFVKTPLF